MQRLRNRHSEWLIHLGIVLTFLLIPVWLRLPQSPILAQLYVTRFLILLPMLWSIFWWIILGVPGLRELLHARWRALWALALLLLALWGFTSIIWAFVRVDHPDVIQTAALQFGVSALFAVVVACSAPSPRVIVGVLVFDVVWNAVITILQAQNQGSIGLIVLGEFPYTIKSGGVSILESGTLRWVRPYGLLPHPNLLGGALMVGLTLTAAWILSSKRWQRIAGIVVFAFGFWAFLLTFSRAAWVGLFVGFLAAILFLRAHLRRMDARISMAIAAGVIVAVGIAFVIGYRPLLEARVGEDQESVELRSVSDRLVFIDFALRSISERPILGVGVGDFPWRMSYYLAETNYDLRGDNVHNVLLSAAAELGIVGLLLLVGAIVFGLIEVIRGLRASHGDDDRAARLALFAAFMALLAVGVLDHYPWTQLQFQVAWWGCLALAMPRFSGKNEPEKAQRSALQAVESGA